MSTAPVIKRSVVIVDTNRPDAPAALERWVADGATGIRLRPDVRSPGDDPLAKGSGVAVAPLLGAAPRPK